MRIRSVPLSSGVELHTVWWEPEQPVDGAVPWLLVHGLASNARLWDGIGRRLAAAGHLAVAVDQRGHGQSSKVDGPFDMETVADDLTLLLAELGWERANLVGQSWGGNVVIETASRHPERVALVVCVDGGFIELQERMPDWAEAAERMAPPRFESTPVAQVEAWLASSAADWPEEGRRGTLFNFEVRADGTVAPWLTFDRHLSVLRGLWEHRPTTRYPTITAPVLMIGADSGDGGWAETKHDAIERAVGLLPRGRAVWFSPAHHDVHAQKPDEVTDVLLAAATDPSFFD